MDASPNSSLHVSKKLLPLNPLQLDVYQIHYFDALLMEDPMDYLSDSFLQSFFSQYYQSNVQLADPMDKLLM